MTDKQECDCFACIGSAQPIHKKPDKQDWEERFDELFSMNSNGGIILKGDSDEDGRTDFDILKSFISSLLRQERERVLGEVLKALPEEKIIPDHECTNRTRKPCPYLREMGYNDYFSKIKNIISKL